MDGRERGDISPPPVIEAVCDWAGARGFSGAGKASPGSTGRASSDPIQHVSRERVTLRK